MQRVLIFAGSTISWVPRILESYLEAISTRDDINCVGVCLLPGKRPGFQVKATSLLAYATKVFFNFGDRERFELPVLTTGWDVARKYDVDIIDAPRGGINRPDFVRMLSEQLAPTLALSVGCLQIWGSELLRTFDTAVNYHNGYLPHYKGLWAGHWSIYQGEESSGYAFHVMEEGVDTGPIIARGLVPILESDSPASLERRKTESARKDVGKVLDAMLLGVLEPIPQSAQGSYFSERRSKPMWTIEDPGHLSAEEIYLRLRCFAPLQILIDDTSYPVTSLKSNKNKSASLSFETADGVSLYPNRIQYLPVSVYRAAKFFQRLARR
jgi:folate-dependent phosphoribosylglycinamide formyltransferase PurN